MEIKFKHLTTMDGWINMTIDQAISLIKKQHEALEYTKAWLNTNMDEPPPEGIQEDSANLLQKINEILE